MKRITSILLCLMILMTIAIPVSAEGTEESQVSAQPSAPVTDPMESQHVCNFTEVISSVEATCTAPGSKTLKCSCGETKTEEYAAKGHAYGTAMKADDIQHKSVCSVCGDEVTSDHSWNGGMETTPANCKQDGVKTYTCTGCGATKAEIIPRTGIHSWTKTNSAAEHACSTCGIKEAHSLKEEVVKKATCKEDGSKKKYCTVCGYSETIVLTKLTTHTYDSACDPECNVCGRKRDIEHTFTTVWSKGYEGHWHECTKCGEKKDFAKHTAGPAATEEKDQVCTVCSYVITAKKEHKHSYESEWTSDKTGHWHACTGRTCDVEKDFAAHNYDDECDSDCNTCGYERENSHQYDTEGWMTSNFEHWNVCSVCGEESVREKHIPGSEATEKEAQLCTVCSYELAPRLEHTHDFGTNYIGTQLEHWQECECGELSVPEPHVWDEGRKSGKDIITFRCTACGEEKTEAVPSSFSWLTLILVILALICIGGIAVLVFILKRGGFDEGDEDQNAESENIAEEFEEDYEDDSEEKMIDDYFASLDEELYK